MIQKQLPEVCKIQYGFPFDSAMFTTSGGMPLVRIRDVVRGYSETYTSEQCSENYIVHNGDLLIGMDGEFNIAKWNGGKALLNQRVCRLIPNDIIDEDYLLFFMPNALKKLEEQTPFVTVKHLSAKQLNSIAIPVPELEEQKHISKALGKSSALIHLYQEQLVKLDDLVKARFFEVFGCCDLSAPGPDWVSISDIGRVIGGATPKTDVPEYWDGDFPWITPADIESASGYVYSSTRSLTREGIESCSLQRLPVGTVILSSRAPIGKVAIAGRPLYCNQGFKNIICGHKILPRYLYTLLLYNTQYLNDLGRGATFKEVSKAIVEKIKIPVPDLDRQAAFAGFAEKVDESKAIIQKSLDKARQLFDSLMQKYFG